MMSRILRPKNIICLYEIFIFVPISFFQFRIKDVECKYKNSSQGSVQEGIKPLFVVIFLVMIQVRFQFGNWIKQFIKNEEYQLELAIGNFWRVIKKYYKYGDRG